MSYELFLSQMKRILSQRLGSGYRLSVRQIQKNNGLILEGLSIQKEDAAVAPTIYLDPFYQLHLKGLSPEQAADRILQLYEASLPDPAIDPARLADPAFVLPRLALRLINAASNASLLPLLPYRPLLDLAAVCFLLLSREPEGHTTLLVTRQHMEIWGLSQDELFSAALSNTPRLLPAWLCPVSQALGFRSGPGLPSPKAYSSLYVLSNTDGLNGAAALLYPGILRSFASQHKSDLVILPSSIHEVLLLPRTEEVDPAALGGLVTEINRTQVTPEDRLSNQVYLYSRAADQTTVYPGPLTPLA